MKDKYGLVVLLDALGSRTASTESAEAYLNAITLIRSHMVSARDIALWGVSKSDRLYTTILQAEPKFFGDSILMTCELHEGTPLHDYVERFTYIVGSLVTYALQHGILFRGAMTIGRYLERSGVTLGPAINDAATWYDQIEMVGVMGTPNFRTRLMSTLDVQLGQQFNPDEPIASALYSYPIPTKRGQIDSYILNWPFIIDSLNTNSDPDAGALHWYLEKISACDIAFGTEDKYRNTELFVRAALNRQPRAEPSPPPYSSPGAGSESGEA